MEINMKITFNRHDILNKIAPLMSVVSGKSTLTAADGILIEANAPDSCNLTAFDLEKGIKITVNADVLEEGSYIINAQKFNHVKFPFLFVICPVCVIYTDALPALFESRHYVRLNILNPRLSIIFQYCLSVAFPKIRQVLCISSRDFCNHSNGPL